MPAGSKKLSPLEKAERSVRCQELVVLRAASSWLKVAPAYARAELIALTTAQATAVNFVRDSARNLKHARARLAEAKRDAKRISGKNARGVR